jgi:HEAT repeat protein
LKRLKTDGTFVKPSFLVALGRIGDATAIPVLVWASRDPAGWVRVCAIQALGQLRAPEAGEIARERLHDPSWSVRGAAADCLGVASGDGEIVRGLLEALEDPHPWPRRCALYALGRRAIGEAAPRVREELNHPVAEVRLAAIWALGRFQDDGAREPLLSLLRVTSPTRDIPLTLAQGEGAVKLLSDAEGRLFDTLVQALGRICRTASDPLVHRALAEARARLTEEELDRPARLPSPEGADGVAAPSLRQVFDLAESACGDDDDL